MEGSNNSRIFIFIFLIIAVIVGGCVGPKNDEGDERKVPHEGRWGVHSLELATEETELIYSNPNRISGLHLNDAGNEFVFSLQVTSGDEDSEEIVSMKTDGTGYKQLTDNDIMDTYPVWSPDGTSIAYLSFRETLDIFLMDADGSDQLELYDSGGHDADIDWVGNTIVYTSESCIWIMDDNGTGGVRLTNPPRAGQWGDANLPFGDYDPRLSPDGERIVFERLEDDISPHGNYNLFIIDRDGSNEVKITDTGYSQGLASWSHSGDRIVYIISAVGIEGKYDIRMIDPDGTNEREIMPEYYPDDLLVHSVIFSKDDSKLYFIGEWWEN